MLPLVCNWTEEEEQEVKGLVYAFKEKRRGGGEGAVVFFVSGLPNSREDKKESRALDKSFRKKRKKESLAFSSLALTRWSLSLLFALKPNARKRGKGLNLKKNNNWFSPVVLRAKGASG